MTVLLFTISLTKKAQNCHKLKAFVDDKTNTIQILTSYVAWLITSWW